MRTEGRRRVLKGRENRKEGRGRMTVGERRQSEERRCWWKNKEGGGGGGGEWDVGWSAFVFGEFVECCWSGSE